MKKFLNYFKYIIVHKYYVFVAAKKYKCSLWRVFVHDMSKFLPDEFFPYADTFYDELGNKRFKPSSSFDMAWFKHQRRNLHHWENWVVLNKKTKSLEVLEMPEEYAREMVADWAGAGKVITGRWEINEWYEKERGKIILHEKTKNFVESLIKETKWI